jgi:L-rhamnose isomerase/sugar isomerase
MKIDERSIEQHNRPNIKNHNRLFSSLASLLEETGIDKDKLINEIASFQVAIPSWALGTGGTRFGRFPQGGEPRNLEEKISDIGLVHAINRSSGAISLHIPWDIPGDYQAVRQQADSLNIKFDAVNSNTFQDQPGQKYSYRYGSLCHTDPVVRQQAVDHNIEVIEHGRKLGSKALTVWLADGSNFPGQQNFRTAFENTFASLKEIYAHLPADWELLLEYKPYEPNFYSMVIPDWGTSYSLVSKLGKQAFTLVDLGHHLPNTNIEQVVSTLMTLGKLGGFHFNDSKFSDDDLTVGAIKPYQLFLIFNELVFGMDNNPAANPPIAWMIDASHNIKDPLEDLLQSVESIKIAYAQAKLVNRNALQSAQQDNDVTLAQEIIQDAFRTDVRPLIAEARLRSGAALSPVGFYRDMEIRKDLIKERGIKSVATGL